MTENDLVHWVPLSVPDGGSRAYDYRTAASLLINHGCVITRSKIANTVAWRLKEAGEMVFAYLDYQGKSKILKAIKAFDSFFSLDSLESNRARLRRRLGLETSTRFFNQVLPLFAARPDELVVISDIPPAPRLRLYSDEHGIFSVEKGERRYYPALDNLDTLRGSLFLDGDDALVVVRFAPEIQHLFAEGELCLPSTFSPEENYAYVRIDFDEWGRLQVVALDGKVPGLAPTNLLELCERLDLEFDPYGMALLRGQANALEQQLGDSLILAFPVDAWTKLHLPRALSSAVYYGCPVTESAGCCYLDKGVTIYRESDILAFYGIEVVPKHELPRIVVTQPSLDELETVATSEEVSRLEESVNFIRALGDKYRIDVAGKVELSKADTVSFEVLSADDLAAGNLHAIAGLLEEYLGGFATKEPPTLKAKRAWAKSVSELVRDSGCRFRCHCGKLASSLSVTSTGHFVFRHRGASLRKDHGAGRLVPALEVAPTRDS